jgi:hypothetical protein
VCKNGGCSRPALRQGSAVFWACVFLRFPSRRPIIMRPAGLFIIVQINSPAKQYTAIIIVSFIAPPPLWFSLFA